MSKARDKKNKRARKNTPRPPSAPQMAAPPMPMLPPGGMPQGGMNPGLLDLLR
jgi:hypothetical protein